MEPGKEINIGGEGTPHKSTITIAVVKSYSWHRRRNRGGGGLGGCSPPNIYKKGAQLPHLKA